MRNGLQLHMLAIAVLWVALLGSHASRATILAYDDFESYTATNQLNGGNGGTGWTGNWVAVDPTDTTLQAKVMDDPASNVDGGAQALRFQPTANRADVASFIQRAIPVTSGTIYMGMLFRKEAGVDSGDFINFQVSNGATGNTTAAMGVGLRNAGGNPFFARVGSSSSGVTNNGPASAINTDYLLVAKFWKDGSTDYNRVDLFLNPADENEPGAATATATWGGTGISNLSLFTVRNYQPELGDTLFIDELRFADTFADAVGYIDGPVPEPGTLTLLGAAALFLIRRRRAHRA